MQCRWHGVQCTRTNTHQKTKSSMQVFSGNSSGQMGCDADADVFSLILDPALDSPAIPPADKPSRLPWPMKLCAAVQALPIGATTASPPLPSGSLGGG
eukprot:3563277-Lingulodinium_polyedra.AAC.1